MVWRETGLPLPRSWPISLTERPAARRSMAACTCSTVSRYLRPPFRPRAVVAARPSLVRSRLRSRSIIWTIQHCQAGRRQMSRDTSAGFRNGLMDR